MKRHGRYFVALGVLLAATIVLTLLMVPGSAWVAIDRRRSSMRTTPDGIAAWSRSLERLGLPVAPRFTSLTAEPPGDGALVLLEPILSPTAAEIGVLLGWIRAGGVLVYSPLYEDLLFDSLGLAIVAGAGMGQPYASGRLLPHRWTEGVEGDGDAALWAIEADSARALSWVPLAITPNAPHATLAWVPEGAGGVLAVADATPVTNGALAESTLPVVLTRALADLIPPGDTVRFSEFHQGLDGRRGLVRESLAIATASPVGRVGLHAAAIALLLLFLGGRSFGAPAPEPEGERRSPLEHVEALGRIYETSGSRRSVARRLVRGAARRIGTRARTSEALLLEQWRKHPQASPHAEAAAAAWNEDPPDLTALARALDAVVAAHTTHTDTR